MDTLLRPDKGFFLYFFLNSPLSLVKSSEVGAWSGSRNFQAKEIVLQPQGQSVPCLSPQILGTHI